MLNIRLKFLGQKKFNNIISMTTKQEAAVILIRILASYMFLQALSILPVSATVATVDPVMFLISHEFVTFIISATIWLLAKPLSRFMVKDLPSSEKEISLTPLNSQIEPLIFSTIGLIILVTAIPQLVGMLTYNNAINMIGDDPVLQAKVIASSKSFTVSYLAKCIVGCSLLFFSGKLSKVLQKIRMET